MNQKALPIKKQIELCLEKIRAISYFSQSRIIAPADGRDGLNDKQAAMLKIYLRMNMMVSSIMYLHKSEHYQIVGAAARTLFEMIIDLKALSIDETGETLERYLRFSEIESYRWGKDVVKFYNDRPELLLFDMSSYDWVDDPAIREKIERSARKYWPRSRGKVKKIQHWSGMNKRELCRELDKTKPPGRKKYLCFEELYVLVYSRLSWLIHSGESGALGFDRDVLEMTFCECLLNIEDVFRESTLIVADELIGPPAADKVVKALFEKLDRIVRDYMK